MAKADVLALVDFFLLKPDNTGQADEFYEDVIRELGFKEFLTGLRTQEIFRDQDSYTIATDTVRVLESYTQHKGRLDPVPVRSLRAAHGADWRLRRGSPVHVTRGDESSNVVRLFPIPDDDDTLTFIRTETPDCLPYWLELPIALEIVARLLVQEAPNQDENVATQAKRLALLLLTMLGLQIQQEEPDAADV